MRSIALAVCALFSADSSRPNTLIPPRQLLLAALLATLAYILLPRPAAATPLSFTDEALFRSAAMGLSTLDFEQPSPSGDIQLGAAGFQSGNVSIVSSDGYLVWRDYGTGSNGFLYGAQVSVSPPSFESYIQANLPDGTTAIGAKITGFYVFQNPDQFEILLSTGEIFPFSSIASAEFSGPRGDGFFGVISNTPIDWIRFRMTASTTYTNTDSVMIDDLTFGTAIPEPSTGLLVGAGLVLCAMVTRKTTRPH
jgi:hypothetical protein